MTDIDKALAEAGAALAGFASGPAQRAADALATAFEAAGVRIAGALGQAAAKGEFDMKRLAKVALEALARVALDRIGLPAASTAPRATAPATAPVAVHFHLSGGAGAEDVRRHQAQIAADVARAAAYGRRNL